MMPPAGMPPMMPQGMPQQAMMPQGMPQQAMMPGAMPPPAQMAPPAPAPPPIPEKLKALTLSKERYTYWESAIKKAREKRKAIAAKHDWDGNLERYEPHDPKQGKINIGVDFSDVERKKAALLFDTPSVSLIDVSPGLEPAVAVHAELLNALLGPEHADVQPTALKAIFNCLCPSGIGPVIVGYHCTKQDVDGVIDPMTGNTVPVPEGQKVPKGIQTIKIPVPIAEKWFVSGLSPKSLLLPAELRDTAYQKAAAWLGFDWQKPLSQVRREYDLKEDWTAGGESTEKPYFERDDPPRDDTAGDPQVSGCTIYLRAHLEAKAGETIHPDLIRVLTLADGVSEPLEYRDSPDQTLGPDGRLSADSVIGFNVRPLVLRDLSDSAWIPSDCAQTAALTKEMNKYRDIALNKRKTNVSMVGYSPKISDAMLEAKKTAGDGGTVYIPVPEESLITGQLPAAQLTQAVQQRETYQDQELLRQDRAGILGMDQNQAGVNAGRKKTATESSIVQRNTDARFEQERQRVLKWYLYDIVRPFDALVLRYCDQRMATAILGPEKAQTWLQNKEALKGGYRYSLQMDTGKYLDAEVDRQQFMQVYNLQANNPFLNKEFLTKKLCEKMGWPQGEALAKPEPPHPEPPKVNLAFSGADFAAPQGPVCLAILQTLGVQVDPAAIQAMQNAQAAQAQQALQQAALGQSAKQEQHGGAAEKAPKIDQHQLDLTGNMPGAGPM